MKIALCISGHLRQYDKCVNSLYKNIILPYKTDNYLSIWDRIDVSDERIISSEFIRYLTELYKCGVLVSNFDSIYALCKDKCSELNKINLSYNISNFMCCDYLLSTFIKHACFDLNDYDFIIKCRPDIIVNKFQIDFDLLNANTIYVGWLDEHQAGPGALSEEQRNRAFNPQLIVGDKNSIFKYMEILDDYSYISECLKQLSNIEESMEFLNPHLFPSNFLKSHNIKLKLLKNIDSQVIPRSVIPSYTVNTTPKVCNECNCDIY